jgi:hypothetical protein
VLAGQHENDQWGNELNTSVFGRLPSFYIFIMEFWLFAKKCIARTIVLRNGILISLLHYDENKILCLVYIDLCLNQIECTNTFICTFRFFGCLVGIYWQRY